MTKDCRSLRSSAFMNCSRILNPWIPQIQTFQALDQGEGGTISLFKSHHGPLFLVLAAVRHCRVPLWVAYHQAGSWEDWVSRRKLSQYQRVRKAASSVQTWRQHLEALLWLISHPRFLGRDVLHSLFRPRQTSLLQFLCLFQQECPVNDINLLWVLMIWLSLE